MKKFVTSPHTPMIYSFIFPLFILFTVEWMHRGGPGHAAEWSADHPLEVVFNYFLVFSIINLLLLFTQGKMYFVLSSFLGVLLALSAYVSYVKSDLRGEPLTLLDIRLVKEASDIFGVFHAHYYVPAVVLCLIWLKGAAFTIFYLKPRVQYRWLYYATAVLSTGILLYAIRLDFGDLSKHRISVPADISWNHDKNGFLLATLVDSKFLNVPVPEQYNKASIGEVYRRMSETAGSGMPEERPNVIFILGESFWDLTQYTDLQFSEEPIPFMKTFSERALRGIIEVPSVGGGTANTEYEVLTGLSKKFIDNYSVPYNPYNSYIHRPVPSIARIFKAKGYHTAGFHSYHGWFYRRSEVYKHLGFDRFVSLEFFPVKPDVHGYYAEDEVLYQSIIDEITRTPERNFISAITMEGHGPYKDIPLTDKRVELISKLSDSSRDTVEKYANLVHGVDANFAKLIQYFESFDEPTLVVFYSDHIPPFGHEVYQELGFPMYGQGGKRVPVYIWSNYKKLTGEAEMQANMLGAFVLELIGWDDDPYMNYLNQYRRDISPFVDKAADEARFRDFEFIHYDIMHGQQYLREFGKAWSENEVYELGYPIQMNRIDVFERKNMYFLDIKGEGMGWMSALTVNGRDYRAMYSSADRITAMVPKEAAGKVDMTVQVKVKDSRDKVIKASLPRKISLQEPASEAFGQSKDWKSIMLGEQQEWEYFAERGNTHIVRVNLELPVTPLYFVETDDLILTDSNADRMDQANQSDIYPNGYLYLSISKADSGWKGRPDRREIQQFIAARRYELHLKGNE